MPSPSRPPGRRALVLSVALIATFRGGGAATAQQGTVVQTTIDCPSLEGNLAGDPPRRPLSIYMPPSYPDRPTRHYPAVYLLHGYQGSHKQWMAGGKEWNIRDVMDRL